MVLSIFIKSFRNKETISNENEGQHQTAPRFAVFLYKNKNSSNVMN
jgi:hypothetical protein